MRKLPFFILTLATGLVLDNLSFAADQGEIGFKAHCAACHAEGGNVIRPDKTLSRADREKHGITTIDAIVNLIRNPGPGMETFDREALSDREARDIADYIIRTFR